MLPVHRTNMEDNPIFFDEEEGDDQDEEEDIISATLIDEIPPNSEIREAPEVFSTGAAGVRQFQWGLHGMDCPDCASTAKKALSRIKGLQSCEVSATSGLVEITLNLERANAAQANAMLSSLGYASKAEWYIAENIDIGQLQRKTGFNRQEINRRLREAEGVLEVDLNHSAGIAFQWVSPTGANIRPEISLSRSIPYPWKVQPLDMQKLRPDQARLIAGIAVLPLFAMVLLLQGMGQEDGVFGIVLKGAAITGTIVAGWRTFIEAWVSLRSLQFTIPVLTSLAMIGALLIGAWEEAILVAILIAIAASLEGLAVERARSSMTGGFDRRPATARKLIGEMHDESDEHSSANGGNKNHASGISLPIAGQQNRHCEITGSELVPVNTLVQGDCVEVLSGEMIPVDGKIVQGFGSVDRTPLTGEPLPTPIEEGDWIEAGLILASGPVQVEVEAVGEATRLAGLIDLVHEQRLKPARLHSHVHLFTKVWIPLVIVAGPLLWLIQGDVSKMLMLWVVACPCALLLAGPIPHTAAQADAGRRGAIICGGDVIERLAQIDSAFLDKTGTLTTGKPTLASIAMSRGMSEKEILHICAALEVHSRHPYATAILEAAPNEPPQILMEKIQERRSGIEGREGGIRWWLGSRDDAPKDGPKWYTQAIHDADQSGHGVSILLKNGRPNAVLCFVHDDLRQGIGQMVSSLEEQNVRVELLSGDDPAATVALGALIGLSADRCHGGLSPEQKVAFVEKAAESSGVLMAGDGFNDSAALAAADVGIAVGTGDSVSLIAADVLIPGEETSVLPGLINLSRRTRSTVWVNLAVSVGITIILTMVVLSPSITGIPLALGIIVHEIGALFVILYGVTPVRKGGRWEALKGLGVDLVNETKTAFEALLGTQKIGTKDGPASTSSSSEK